MKENMSRKYTAKATSCDPEVEMFFIRTMCRELILEELGTAEINEARFEQVMSMVMNGEPNIFDAPILYTLVSMNKIPVIEEPK